MMETKLENCRNHFSSLARAEDYLRKAGMQRRGNVWRLFGIEAYVYKLKKNTEAPGKVFVRYMCNGKPVPLRVEVSKNLGNVKYIN
jgi:hypothetical protein